MDFNPDRREGLKTIYFVPPDYIFIYILADF